MKNLKEKVVSKSEALMLQVHNVAKRYDTMIAWAIACVLVINPLMGTFWMMLVITLPTSNMFNVWLSVMNALIGTFVALSGAVMKHLPTFMAFGVSAVIGWNTAFIHTAKVIWMSSHPLSVCFVLLVHIIVVLVFRKSVVKYAVLILHKGENRAEEKALLGTNND